MNKFRQKFLSILLSVCMLMTCLMAFGISAQAAAASTDEGLMVGAAMAQITPTSDMYPMTWGSGNRGFAFIGAVEHIYLRVIAVSNAGKDASPENTALILGFDTGKGPYPPDMIALLSEKTGVSEDNIFWSTTHMHSAPEITNANWKEKIDIDIRTDTPANTLADTAAKNLAKWGAMIQKRLVAAAQEAIKNMEPAEVSLATTTCNINVNRDTQYSSNLVTNPYDIDGDLIPGTLEGFNGQGASDKTLTVVEFRSRETKEELGFIVHYAMHNTLLYANDYFNPDFNEAHGVKVAAKADIEDGVYDVNDIDKTKPSSKLELNVAYCEPYEKNYRSIESLTTADNKDGLTSANAAVHPDVGGLVSQYLEKKYDGSVALWMSGAAGDQNPVLRNTMNFESPYTGEVLEIPIDGGFLESATYYASIQFVDVQRAIAKMEAADNFESDTPIGFAWGTSEVDPIEEQYYQTDSKTGEKTLTNYPKVPLFMTTMRLGSITLAGVPSEPYNAIGVAMRDESNLGSAKSEYTLVVNHCWTHAEENDYRSYYPDDVAILNNSYRWGTKVKYPVGVINGAYIDLLESLWKEAGAKILK